MAPRGVSTKYYSLGCPGRGTEIYENLEKYMWFP
jgi:hypothetical protein